MKIAIVVLILIAVLFAVSVGVGLGDKSDKDTESKKAQNGDQPWWAGIFKDKDGNSRMPGMKLPKSQYEITLPPGKMEIPIDPSSSPFRLLKLAHGEGGEILVSFKSKEPPNLKGMDDPQTLTLIPSGPEDHKNHRFVHTSVVVFKSGGTLTLTLGSGPLSRDRKGSVKVE
jgi:hypothetical protein